MSAQQQAGLRGGTPANSGTTVVPRRPPPQQLVLPAGIPASSSSEVTIRLLSARIKGLEAQLSDALQANQGAPRCVRRVLACRASTNNITMLRHAAQHGQVTTHTALHTRRARAPADKDGEITALQQQMKQVSQQEVVSSKAVKALEAQVRL